MSNTVCVGMGGIVSTCESTLDVLLGFCACFWCAAQPFSLTGHWQQGEMDPTAPLARTGWVRGQW